MSFVVALVGRPNVGKSTLFNRLAKNKKAIIHDSPGVTRDRKYADASLGPLEFTVIDTPGFEEAKEERLEHRMMMQTMAAINSADLVLLVVDGSKGVLPDDKHFAKKIRNSGTLCLTIVNKSEKLKMLDGDFYKLGFGTPLAISAEHGNGMADLCEIMMEHEPEAQEQDEFDIENPEFDNTHNAFLSKQLQIAIVGRPNSGKSTYINAILNEARMLTGPEAGITRDSVDIDWEYKGRSIKLVDTAGMRRKSNVNEQIEKASVGSALQTIRFANTVVLMLDATIPLEQQDLNIARLVINEGRALVIGVNKWDLIEDKKEYIEELEYMLSRNLGQVKGVPYVLLSALNQENIYKVIDACFNIYELWNKKIPTSALNNWLSYALEQHQLPLMKTGRRARIKFCNQWKTRPPHFKFFTNHPDAVDESYQKYLLNSLRDIFEMPGVQIRFTFVKGENPYHGKKRRK